MNNHVILGLFKLGDDYETPRLEAAAKKLGVETRVIMRNELQMRVDGERFGVSYRGFDLSNLTHALFRNGKIASGDLRLGYQRDVFIQWLVSQGVRVLNQDSYLKCSIGTKLWEPFLLAKSMLPVVRTYSFGSFEDIPKSFFSTPKVIKQIYGSGGARVWKFESMAAAEELIRERGIGILIFQDFHEVTHDVRVLVIGDTCVGAMKRLVPESDFRSNVSLGGKFVYEKLTEEMKSLAIRATKAMGYDYAGVDLLPTIEGLKVLEVNKTAQFKGFESCTGVDVSSKILEYLLSNV